MLRGQSVMVAGLALTGLLGLGLFWGTPRKQPETRPDGKLQKRVRNIEDRMQSLEEEVSRLNRKMTIVVNAFDRRLSRLEETGEKNAETPTEQSRRPSKKEGPPDKLSPRVKKLYQSEKPRQSKRVEGLSYRALQEALQNSTREGKKKLSKALQGTAVNWSGQVQSVQTSGQASRVTVNMYGDPETFPSATVTFTVPARIGKALNKGERIRFTGRIKSLDPQFGSITLGDASVQL